MADQGPKGETLKGHMGPGPWDGSQLESLIAQAVGQATDRESAAKALSTALARHGAKTVPRSAGALSAFVLGALHDVLLEGHGEDAAERVLKILRPVIKKRSELELGPMEMGSAPTVLVVDDDIVVRAQLLSILGAAGYRVASAPDSNVALAMSVRCRPDVIVSDLGLGRVRESHLAALLNVAFRHQAPPIVLLNATGREIRVPGVIVIDKPLDRVTLLQAVDLCIRRAAAQIA
jgi:CheY-like chemotaxis protein